MKGLFIKSENNNTYFYNDETGFIDYVKEPVLDIKLNKDIKESEEVQLLTSQDVKEHLFNDSGFKHLVLEVTQDCNLRCKYCVYSDHYKTRRDRSNEFMTFEIAKKAVDFFISSIKAKKFINPCKTPCIGFYGGEPLLNFKLIKEVVKYIKNTYPEFEYLFSITTNGLLLEDEVGDFLVENKSCIVVSLDGDKENHDRNRIRPDGSGSFDIVMKNIERFRNRHPDYDMIGISACYDYDTDLEKLRDFIEENKLFVVNMSLISSVETDYYNQFTEKQKEKFYESYNKLNQEFFNLVKEDKVPQDNKNIFAPLFITSYVELSCHSVVSKETKSLLPYCSTCVPGEKIYVSTKGVFHTCERVSDKFPIGNVDEGLNFDNIAKMLNVYKVHEPICKNCDVSRLCNYCFTQISCGDKLIITDELCEKRKEDCKTLLSNYVSLMESNPREFDKITSKYIEDLQRQTKGSLF